MKFYQLFEENLGWGRGEEGKMSTTLSMATLTLSAGKSRYSLPAAGILVSWGSFFFQFCFLAFTGSVFILILSKANEKNIQQKSTFAHPWCAIFHIERHHSAGVSQSNTDPKTMACSSSSLANPYQTLILEQNENPSLATKRQPDKISNSQVVHFSTDKLSPQNPRKICQRLWQDQETDLMSGV